MIRFCTALALVVVQGCSATDVFDNGTDLVVMNPLCVMICIATINAADTDTTGDSNSNATTQTATGAVN